MTYEELNEEYFNWICSHITSPLYFHKSVSFYSLLSCLHKIDFTYTIPMDDNRASDGIELRYKFGSYMEYDDGLIAGYLDDKPCSVLEMLIALSIRCEESIMHESDMGDRTEHWFWEMIGNLKLYSQRDECFNELYTVERIMIFLNREYKPDGDGGLFKPSHPFRDMRSVEIWSQMCWYLDDLIYESGKSLLDI